MTEKTFADFLITPSGLPNDGLIFVNHSVQNRSGHLGHALVECRNGELLAFYPNCNDDMQGHSGNGWMEFKRSYDHGETWNEPEKLDSSYRMWASGCGKTAMCEKAVVTNTGTIVLFHLICDMQVNGSVWEPYWEPTVSRSMDNGHTWSGQQKLCSLRGRVYDALYRDSTIYVLMFANDSTEHYAGIRPEHRYLLFTSRDDGYSFQLSSTLSLPTLGRCYGTMEFLENGDIIAYVYDIHDESHPDYCISHYLGLTWDMPQKTFLSKCIRNPQMIHFGGGYFMHGRSGSLCEERNHFVLYFSKDGISWDEGHYLCLRGPGCGGYSNSIVVGQNCAHFPHRLLIQTSHPYREHRTNVLYWWVDTK